MASQCQSCCHYFMRRQKVQKKVALPRSVNKRTVESSSTNCGHYTWSEIVRTLCVWESERGRESATRSRWRRMVTSSCPKQWHTQQWQWQHQTLTAGGRLRRWSHSSLLLHVHWKQTTRHKAWVCTLDGDKTGNHLVQDFTTSYKLTEILTSNLSNN